MTQSHRVPHLGIKELFPSCEPDREEIRLKACSSKAKFKEKINFSLRRRPRHEPVKYFAGKLERTRYRCQVSHCKRRGCGNLYKHQWRAPLNVIMRKRSCARAQTIAWLAIGVRTYARARELKIDRKVQKVRPIQSSNANACVYAYVAAKQKEAQLPIFAHAYAAARFFACGCASSLS